ncbi:peptidyl-tRNA hydrolase [Gigaspora rosea]|uniref:peptidyl-tRNA hydrolase n=1 Tax=Gigaspora rosea TaxID=44941 RepID=A0A397W8S0_9GLOM|nr:peptidyl-tRNA hydrolase [Gigaspora rosea]
MSRPVDFLIAGLGNPEKEYATTRHNAGYIFIDYLANALALEQGEGAQMPPVFYRRFDLSVQKVMQYYAVNDSKRLIVVVDDLNTLPDGGELAAMRGHKGLENIVSTISTGFVRFRLGIGRPAASSTPISQWVLSQFTKENREMDLFGYLLQLTTLALKDYSIHQDLKLVKKKFARPKKIPNKLPEINRCRQEKTILFTMTLKTYNSFTCFTCFTCF